MTGGEGGLACFPNGGGKNRKKGLTAFEEAEPQRRLHKTESEWEDDRGGTRCSHLTHLAASFLLRGKTQKKKEKGKGGPPGSAGSVRYSLITRKMRTVQRKVRGL